MTLNEATRILRRSIVLGTPGLLGHKVDASSVVHTRIRWPVVLMDGAVWQEVIELNGHFSANELEAMVVWMRAHISEYAP